IASQSRVRAKSEFHNVGLAILVGICQRSTLAGKIVEVRRRPIVIKLSAVNAESRRAEKQGNSGEQNKHSQWPICPKINTARALANPDFRQFRLKNEHRVKSN